MPNTGRITVCPFYRNDRNKTISCEDVFRRFRFLKKKQEWMNRYCDLDWEACPYARELIAVYEAKEKGDDMAETNHIIKALEKENKGLSVRLTRAEKRIEDRDETIKDLRKKNRHLEQRYMDIRNDIRAEQVNAEKFYKEMAELGAIYESRFCYLMHNFSGGVFDETAFNEWCKGKEYRLVPEKDDKGRVTRYIADVREIKDGNKVAEDTEKK